ncbi:penicillin-binding protein 2 [candidate division WOR-1 bacterium RIFOXYA12_FULL_52_29]|uniref:Penicillin-binding protein 2 n=1 Tax=candidate division WOR-1 bacterium RIFOXYC12_FULL_54_18 TaxID=1802584 RepID=A0A1F4T7M9_UNCSA|nr:MAG: penicillin-binding protein 2 [candidate division WOR-1 bacterium RIFOXYA2_FULL_51_19]OGC18384.1 MAG: penicillin-binding protein 2 [candidate division WOR-1 bacterium RIFOXYA12_FULL_52_29]OGC27239.1 MAG: penicillin-binding protein 2 [candidate division WOR-1 bacterium RIFOXYB2_FULL_45_9]OGC28801.1 MAG: penicillin-binding protein 2 [candidate division WOR-1 bacterium RIFOXYC12_FULL_54_18]OGC30745.1 MAG: penicillin-binding protein 2 [candidate division WOR-1 bacterium RIFOXYB12_FULL_52_16]
MNKDQALWLAITLAFLVIFGRLFQLQVIEGGKYRRLALENAAKTIPIYAPRGIIYDRVGKIIAQNQAVFSIQVMPQLLSDHDPERRDRVLKKLSAILGEEVKPIKRADRPILIKDNIDVKTAITVEELGKELKGVEVVVHPVRLYPYGKAASHLLGYVGEIEADELKRLKIEGYRLGDTIGKDGIEKIYDKLIRGKDGGKRIEVDVRGNPIRVLGSVNPAPGADVFTTIDIELQQAADVALGAKIGAVVVLDPRSGELLSLVSHPNYDPNIFVKQLESVEWEKLEKKRHPFMDRALAIYPPGSIFKAIVLTAALEKKVTEPKESFFCPGYYRINNRIARCWKESGHGRITAEDGLVNSCDIVFYELGRRLGPDLIAEYSRKYGLGERTGLDLPHEKIGLVPDTAWKKRALGEGWYEGDSINYGIGQGFLQVTPIQMAKVYGTIATGRQMRPYIVTEIRKKDGEALYQQGPKEVGVIPGNSETVKVVRDALREVVKRATGRAASVPGIPAAGKTGTAQNPGLPHAWFICYAPYDEPEIVIASFVEHGEHGDQSSAHVARDILKWYKENRLQKEYAEE